MTMTDVTKRDEERATRPDLFGRFDRVFGEWMTSLPFRRTAERKQEEKTEGRGYVRSEHRYGKFTRT
jgi:hypothetical protein